MDNGISTIQRYIAGLGEIFWLYGTTAIMTGYATSGLVILLNHTPSLSSTYSFDQV